MTMCIPYANNAVIRTVKTLCNGTWSLQPQLCDDLEVSDSRMSCAYDAVSAESRLCYDLSLTVVIRIKYDVSSSVKTLIDPTPRINSHQGRAQCVQVETTGRMVAASLQILHK